MYQKKEKEKEKKRGDMKYFLIEACIDYLLW
jgi:hypothetical protein